MHGSVKVCGKDLQNVWWNDEIKAAVERNEVVWKESRSGGLK